MSKKPNGSKNENPSQTKSVQTLVAGRRAIRPMPAQVAGAGEVARELRSAKQYGTDFAAPCPRAEEVASVLETAATLSAEEAALTKRLAELARERGAAWTAALAAVQVLGRFLEASSFVDGSVESRYPALAAFVHARAPVAARSAATKRAEKRKAKAAPPPATPHA